MKRQQAIRTVVDFVSGKLSNSSLAEQIKIYDALALAMPTKKERRQAERIAWTLREAAKMQLDFTKQLFTEIKWPGHRHDGETDN
jgi:hypothetical protein